MALNCSREPQGYGYALLQKVQITILQRICLAAFMFVELQSCEDLRGESH